MVVFKYISAALLLLSVAMPSESMASDGEEMERKKALSFSSHQGEYDRLVDVSQDGNSYRVPHHKASKKFVDAQFSGSCYPQGELRTALDAWNSYNKKTSSDTPLSLEGFSKKYPEEALILKRNCHVAVRNALPPEMVIDKISGAGRIHARNRDTATDPIGNDSGGMMMGVSDLIVTVEPVERELKEIMNSKCGEQVLAKVLQTNLARLDAEKEQVLSNLNRQMNAELQELRSRIAERKAAIEAGMRRLEESEKEQSEKEEKQLADKLPLQDQGKNIVPGGNKAQLKAAKRKAKRKKLKEKKNADRERVMKRQEENMKKRDAFMAEMRKLEEEGNKESISIQKKFENKLASERFVYDRLMQREREGVKRNFEDQIKAFSIVKRKKVEKVQVNQDRGSASVETQTTTTFTDDSVERALEFWLGEAGLPAQRETSLIVTAPKGLSLWELGMVNANSLKQDLTKKADELK